MARRVMASVGLAAGLAAGLALLAGGAMAAETGGTQPHRQILVSGEGIVSAVPDMARVTLGVVTEGRTAAEAMTANSTRLARVFDALKAAGIAARDMQTSGLSLQPKWSRPASASEARRILGFTASNQVTIRVRKLDTLGTALDALVKAGANDVNGVSFSVAEQGALLDKARAEAVRNARHRAEILAAAAGVKLGPVVSISELGASAPRPMLRMTAMTDAAPVPIAAGELDLTAQVTMVFEIGQ